MILTFDYKDFTSIRLLSLIKFNKDSIEIIHKTGNKKLNATYELTPDSVEVHVDDTRLNTEDCKALMMLLLSFEVEDEIKVD